MRLGAPAPSCAQAAAGCALARLTAYIAPSASTRTCSALSELLVDQREADARRRMQHVVADVDAAGADHAREALGDDAAPSLVDVRQQHGELVAAEARDEVRLAQPPGERPGDRLERLVADRRGRARR